MKISQLKDATRGYKVVGAGVAKQVLNFAKRYGKTPDRDLDVNELYALAYILFADVKITLQEEGLIKLLRHQIWGDDAQQMSDAYCQNMFKALQTLKTNGLALAVYYPLLVGQGACLELAGKLVELEQNFKIDSTMMSFLKNYPHGSYAASKLIGGLIQSNLYVAYIIDFVSTLQASHDAIVCLYLPALRLLHKEGMLFDGDTVNAKMFELIKTPGMQLDNLVEALKLLKAGNALDASAMDAFVTFVNLNPVIIAKRIIREKYPPAIEPVKTAKPAAPMIDRSSVLSFFGPRTVEEPAEEAPLGNSTPTFC